MELKNFEISNFVQLAPEEEVVQWPCRIGISSLAYIPRAEFENTHYATLDREPQPA